MDFTTVAIATTTAGIEAVTGSLLNIGLTGFQIEDAADFQEFLESTTPHWDYVEDSLMSRLTAETTVTVYLPQNEQGSMQMIALRNELERLKAYDTDGSFGRLEITTDSIRESDWENNWKEFFHPFPVGRRFIIRPVWEHPEQGDRAFLSLDPGCAFGSGQHETTQLCLGLLEDVVKPGDHVLDMGCGSGILSIAAGLLEASDVMAVDIDENATRMTRENWDCNPITCPLTVYCGDVLSDVQLAKKVAARKYQVVAANIVADVLIAMAPQFADWLAPGGTLLVSGIILPRVQDVLTTLQSLGYAVLELREQDEWAAARLKLRDR